MYDSPEVQSDNEFRSRLTSTGLSTGKARYYNPNIGRFISEDPIAEMATQNPARLPAKALPAVMSTKAYGAYSYVSSNPILRKDPTGLYGTTDCSYYTGRCNRGGLC